MKPTIRAMRVREAKDFLVAQTTEQAALEGVPLSDLEKRMMYFTESGYVPEDPIKLNGEFEAEYDTPEYEAKISRLLHHVYHRLRKENDAARKNWDQAIRCLRHGDHYLLVMWDLTPPGERPPGDSLKLFASALAVIAVLFLGIFLSRKFEPQWRWLQKHIPQPNPHVLLGVFIAFILTGLVFQRPFGDAVGWLLDRVVLRFMKPNEDDKDTE